MNSATESDLWILCPVCHKKNPPGRRFCQHCWGAVLHPDIPASSQELEEIAKRRQSYLKRGKIIKVTTTFLVSATIVALAVFFSLYYLTDTISKPLRELNSNSLPGEWAMFRHDLARSGAADSTGILPQGKEKWRFSTGGSIHSSPAVAAGTVYFGSSDNKLYALDAATGAKRWEYETGSWVESSPSIVNNIVYFGSNDGRLYALDAHSGEKLWDFKTKYAIYSSPAIANGVVYFGGEDHYVYALDAAKGTKLWDFEADGSVRSSPIITNGIVYFGSGSDFSYALDARTGRLRLLFKTHHSVSSSPAVNDDTVYLINFDGVLSVVDGNARTWPKEHEIKPFWFQVWLMGLPGIPEPPLQSGFLWGLRIGNKTNSSPALSGDILYIGSDNKLVAIDLQEQQKRWEFETEGAIRSSPTVLGNTVYIGSEDGRLYAVDTITGKQLWNLLTGDQITSSPTVAAGTVYVGSHDGNLYAIK